MDSKSGYWQTKMDEEGIPLTTFMPLKDIISG